MFTTKQDVDRHISYILHNISDEKERNSRGYHFAKLYYDVADYESSKRYLHTFLQEAVPQAHKLMGLVYEALKDKNSAIEAYTRSLDIKPNQKDLVLKVSELYVAVNADNVKNREILRPNPTRVDVQMEATPTALSSRLSTLEETLRNNEKQILELFTHLRESRNEIRNLREQVQNWLFQGLTIMSTARSPMSHSFSGTAHATRNMENTSTSSFGSGVPFAYSGQDGIPPHMSQYGNIGGNSRPGSAYGHKNYDEDFHNIDAQDEYFVPDQNLVKEWPFGQEAGVAGKSTITYSRQGQGRVTNPPNASADALRGKSIQYGGNQQPAATPMPHMAPQMSGPGLFSQKYQHMTPPAIHSQQGLFQSQSQFGVMPGKSGVSPTMSPAKNTNDGSQSQTVVNNCPMMPPNAVASQSMVKPTLISGSLDVPPPKKEEKALSQNGLLSTPNVMPFAALSISTSAATTVTPGPAASLLSQLASKHQDDTQGQGSVSVPSSQSTPQKTVFKGFSFAPTPKIVDQKTDDKPDKNIPATTAAAAKSFSGFSFTISSQSVTTTSLSGFGTQSVSQSQSTASPFTIGQNTGSSLSFGSAGVPTSRKEEKAPSQNGLLNIPNVMLFAAPSISTSAATTVTPGPAASLLSQLASKHQDDTHGQGSVSAPSSQSTPQKTVFQGFSFTSTQKIAEQKTDDKPDKNIQATTAAAAKPFSGFSFTSSSQSTTAPMPNMAPQMPGPGFFSQSYQHMTPPAIQSQPGLFQGQGQFGVVPGKPGVSPTMTPARNQNAGTQSQTVVNNSPMMPPARNQNAGTQSQTVDNNSPMMPPNAVASQSTIKPTLIPGSVGIPTPKKEEKVPSQNGLLSTPNVMPFAAPSISTSAATTVTPGPAASLLSQLASKHQDDTQGQGSLSLPSPQSTPQKTVFQGFSFTSTPKIAEQKTDDKPDKNIQATTAAAAKPFSGFLFTSSSQSTTAPMPNMAPQMPGPGFFSQSYQYMTPPAIQSQPATTASAAKPFSGFSFTTSSQSTTTKSLSGFGTQSVSQSQSTGSPFTVGQNTGSSLSFGSLATQGQTSSAFQAAGDSKGFMGAGQPLFGKSPLPRRRNVSAGSDDHIEEYEPNIDFQPVVPLPDLIEVKSGEEDEEKMFCERAKLFRFDKEANQWKERGIGEIKILKHQQSKKVRILMRREQVLKLCANHKISKDMKLTPMSSSDRAWVWNAMDFAQEEVRYEKFAIKFKNPDIAQRFKDAFEKCQADMTDSNQEDVKIEKKVTDSVKSDSEAGKEDLSSLFKQIPGAWTCDGCYIQNNSDILKCPCCNTLKPGVKPEDVKTSTPVAFSSSTGSGFKFGTQPSDQSGSQSGSGFKCGTQPTDSGSGATSGSGFKFETPTKTGPPSGTGFRFETPTTETSQTSFPFGSKPADSTKTSNTPSSTVSGFKFTTAALTATSPHTSKNTFVSGTTNTVTTSRPITTKTSGTDFDLPEICKASSGSQFGGASSQTPDSTNAASSAGFNVNKDATKYSFGSPSKNTAVDSDASKPAENKSNLSGSLLAQFLSSPNSWKCDGCLVNNDGTHDKCPCCGTAQPAAKADDKKESGFVSSAISSSSNSGFKFGSSSGFGSGSSETFSKTAFPSSTKEAGNSSGFSFGTPTKSTSEGFKFNLNPADSPMKEAPASLGSGFNFSLSMNANTTVKSPTTKSVGVMSPKSPEVNDDGYYVEDEGSHIHFEPVIDLPDKVDVKTGEEDEDVLFSHRAKLYRFDKGEWKERGLGDVKVLFKLDSRKARIVMRREQILKLCCNHYIVPELRLKPMPNSKGCALGWFAMDCADGEPRTEQFSIKFKNADIATQFETSVEEAKSRMSEGTIKSEENGEVVADHEEDNKDEDYQEDDDEYDEEDDDENDEKDDDGDESDEDEEVAEVAEKRMAYKEGMFMGDKGNPQYSKELDKNDEEEVTEEWMTYKEGIFMDDKGNPQYSEVLDKEDEEEVTEERMTYKEGIFMGDKGNPQHSEELDKEDEEEVTEERMTYKEGIFMGDKGNPQHSEELDKEDEEEVAEERMTYKEGIFMGDKGNPQYSEEFDKEDEEEVTEEQMTYKEGIFMGDKGNPQYSEELDKEDEVTEEPMRSQAGSFMGDKGNPQYSKELDKEGEVIEEPMRSQAGIFMGDKGNPQYSKELDKEAEVIEDSMRSQAVIFTGDKGNPKYSKELDREGEDIEDPMRSQVGIFTRNKGNPKYSKELDKEGEVIEEQMKSQRGNFMGDKGNPQYSKELDKEAEVVEDPMRSQAGIFMGDKGNPQYSKELDKVGDAGQTDASSGGGFVFGGGASSDFSFSSLAQSSNTQAFKTDDSKPFHWHVAGKKLFGATDGTADGDGSGEEGDTYQGEDPHFEPIVPLPELIEVKTGEENETVQFNSRAKLFRFDKDANQWKEKGIGEMKILKHKETGKYRLLLRREQVHKLACNHLLTSELALIPMNTSETSWCWTAQDFSDSEPRIEQLAVKFKTIELAQTFKVKFEEIQAELKAKGE